MKKRLKINGIIMGFCAMVLAFFPAFFLRKGSAGQVEEILEALGMAFILLGQVIRVSARGYKAEHSRDSQKLIQGGPYQVVRNPMYLGILLIGLGVVLMLFKWWAVLFFLVVFSIRYFLLIFKEEKKLFQMFPEEYPAYCAKVPRILPSLNSLVKLDISQYLPLKIIWFKKEIGSILTLLLLTLFIESWEDITQEGLWAYLRQSVWMFETLILFGIFVILLSERTDKKNK